MPGVMLLNGGAEFGPGNETQDRFLIAAAKPGRAFVLTTAVARHQPQLAAQEARAWFKSLHLAVEDLGLWDPERADSPEMAARAAEGGFFYLAGGDPDVLLSVLQGTATWAAIRRSWLEGAALGGSSAGAMALCASTPVPVSGGGWRLERGLGLVAGAAVLPHFDSPGRGLLEALGSTPDIAFIGLDERTALCWSGGPWMALGRGRVTLLRGSRRQSYGSGSAVDGLADPVS
ncbi:MAG TPA: Type 1 glutamine amidotransferase-like domain-containing protein [Candidatus Acidoferrales bacterium]|nr:Type 1 glutamine amidotransferase-like domain-containing protein [Candidatus Acidoferrales bacterium]